MSDNNCLEELRNKISTTNLSGQGPDFSFVGKAFEGWNSVELFFLREALWTLMQTRAVHLMSSQTVTFRGDQLSGVEKQTCEICGMYLRNHIWAEINENGDVVSCSVKTGKT